MKLKHTMLCLRSESRREEVVTEELRRIKSVALTCKVLRSL